jgi:hypothetical protein
MGFTHGPAREVGGKRKRSWVPGEEVRKTFEVFAFFILVAKSTTTEEDATAGLDKLFGAMYAP